MKKPNFFLFSLKYTLKGIVTYFPLILLFIGTLGGGYFLEKLLPPSNEPYIVRYGVMLCVSNILTFIILSFLLFVYITFVSCWKSLKNSYEKKCDELNKKPSVSEYKSVG